MRRRSQPFSPLHPAFPQQTSTTASGVACAQPRLTLAGALQVEPEVPGTGFTDAMNPETPLGSPIHYQSDDLEFEQIDQTHHQTHGSSFASYSGSSASPATPSVSSSQPAGNVSSGEESTPWLDHHDSDNEANHHGTMTVGGSLPYSPFSHQGADLSDITLSFGAALGAPPLFQETNELPLNLNLEVEMDADADIDMAASAPSGDISNSPASPDDGLDQIMQSTTNAIVLGSENLALGDFLRAWAHFGPLETSPDVQSSARDVPLDIRRVREESRRKVDEVRYSDLQGDQCDFQGLNWSHLGTSRNAARARRRASYRNYVNRAGSDRLDKCSRYDTHVPACEDYFRFRRMLVRHDISLAHFQLRSVFACTSRSQIFYPIRRGIYCLNPVTKVGAVALDMGRFTPSNNSVTTLDANCGVLVAGTFLGDYLIKPLHSTNKTKFSEGTITTGPLALTNHIQIHPTRYSHRPVASISSNDHVLRTMDIETEKFMTSVRYDYPLNCTSVSPDLRLRLHVGDEATAAVCCAETGKLAVTLGGHRDYGFACDWSEDGIHVATGSQDKRVKIWDARKWTDSSGNGTPLASIWCEMAGARNLRFSPLGGSSGTPILVAAEEADYVSIIDLKDLSKKQTIDVFGELGGVTFADGGNELNILVSDSSRGGLIQLDRCQLDNIGLESAMARFVKPF